MELLLMVPNTDSRKLNSENITVAFTLCNSHKYSSSIDGLLLVIIL